MNRKQKLALFEDCYSAERTAAVPQSWNAKCFDRGVATGWIDALRCLGLLNEYEVWESEQEE